MTKKIVSFMIIFLIFIGINSFYYEIYGLGVDAESIIGGSGDLIRKNETLNSLIKEESKGDTVDDTMEGANSFLEAGKGRKINEEKLKDTSNFLFNLLLAVAIVLAVIIGMVIGIQFMVASVEEKAKIKEALLPYFVGCVVVFGAFGIWKLAVTILSRW